MRRWFLYPLGTLFTVGAAVAGLGCCAFSAPRYHGQPSDHFDGERFHNPPGVKRHGFGDLLKWARNRQPGPWAEFIDAPSGPPPPRRVGPGELRVTFVNHATALIQLDGLNVLTDPIWSDRATPISFLGPHRVRPPGIRFEDLPPIDVVVISHNHYDHLDLPTLRRLHEDHHPRFVVGLGNAAVLAGGRIPGAVELDWWQALSLSPDVRLTAVPAQHFSSRGMCDRGNTLWAGYVLTGSSGSTYFAGDTGFGPHLAQIAERFGPLRLALLPIGAFRPEWFMGPVHLSPADAVRAAQVLRAATSVAIHFGTFRLGDDGQDEPVQALATALAAADSKVEFWALGFGEGRPVPPPPTR